MEGIADGAKFNLGNVLEAKDGSVFVGTYYDILELCGRLQSTLVFQCVLERIFYSVPMRAVDRLLAQLACRRLKVLLAEGCGDVGGDYAVLCHYLWLHPDSQRIGTAKFHHVSYTLHALDLWNDVDVEVVGDEILVIPAILRAQCVNLQERCLSLCGAHTDSGHLLWQQSLDLADTVLHVHGCHVGVSALLEENVDCGRTGVGGRTAHVYHVLHAIDAFLQWLDYGIHHGICTRSRIGGAYLYRWWCYVGVLLQG